MLLASVEIGQWIQTVSWAADRQADRQRDCENFISVRNWAKNDSLSQGSSSSLSPTEVCKAERKHYTDSNGQGANLKSTVQISPLPQGLYLVSSKSHSFSNPLFLLRKTETKVGVFYLLERV